MRNSDILFIYDAKMCNPNGDPDDENRPRMDVETSRNIVTDVRLKRYIRDYWQYKGEGVFVATVDEKTVDATNRLAYWVIKNSSQGTKDLMGNSDSDNLEKAFKEGKIKASDLIKRIESDEQILKGFIDVRMFGATMPLKDSEKGSFTFTGPVQFNWGYSLNKVEQVYSNTITSTFAGRTKGEGDEYGAMGKDYRLYYSLLAFHGVISAYRAKHTKMEESDIVKLEEALIKAIPLQATESRIGQYPRLMVRAEYNDDETFLGDLRRYVKPDKDEGLRDVMDVTLDISELDKKLSKNSDRINIIRIWQDSDIMIVCNGNIGTIKDIVSDSIKEKIQMI